MKRLVSVLLIVAFLIGLGSALAAFVPEVMVADGPLYPPPIVPPWPNADSITTVGGPLYPPPIVPPWPPNSDSITS